MNSCPVRVILEDTLLCFIPSGVERKKAGDVIYSWRLNKRSVSGMSMSKEFFLIHKIWFKPAC